MTPARAIRPKCWQANAIRRLRFLKNVKGWRRFANGMLPTDVSGRFRIENESTWVEGDLESFLERELYLYGEHEDQLIDHFLNLSTKTVQRTALDIGANIGQHSMKFPGVFDQIHAFEPNPTLWKKFENNMSCR